MNDIKNFIDDMGIAAFEANIKIAGISVVSDSGDVVYQTANWDLSEVSIKVLNLIKGDKSIVLNGATFSVTATSSDAIIATDEGGMGHLLFAPFLGGVLVSYAMAQADTSIALNFLKSYALKLSGSL
jgi:hypothetical protein